MAGRLTPRRSAPYGHPSTTRGAALLRIGIVGCGFIGSLHGYALHVLAEGGAVDARVTVCHDRDHDRASDLAAVHDAEVADSLGELLDAVDAVWVCTWTAEHLPVVRAAVEADVAVFCEKPLAPTLDECEQLAAELRRVPHQVDLPLRNAPVYVELRRRIASGDYGRPMTVTLRSDQFWPITGQYDSAWRSDATKTGGGALVEHSIHDVDLLRWLLGEVTAVSCHTRTFADAAPGSGHLEDAASLLLRYDDPVVATLVSVWHNITSRSSSRRIEVICEDGLLWADNDFAGPLHAQTTRGTEKIPTPVPEWYEAICEPHTRALGFYAVPAREFLDFLTDGTDPDHRPGADEALVGHRIVEAAYRSAARDAEPVAPSGG